ncbi:MAG: hypothetical protein KAV83_06300 [Desulfobacterales bacterium]|nr:hypothetical protein [Desulfobacterales bacterium]
MKKVRAYILCVITLVILFSLCGCAGQTAGTVYRKDGEEYGKVRGAFRHRWWNYYERGVSYADGEFYQEALRDLKEAIRQRKKDQRMARTYGMHFVDYFPHRELGIVYYEAGSLEGARRELELSLSQFPSAKARFYLDRVRKALIEREAKEVTPPRITLSFETDEVWTREDPVVISGVAEDEQYVAAITIKGVPLFLEGSQKRIAFKENLPLFQGRHIIEVAAKNLLGKVTKRQVSIRVDREGPMITLEDLQIDQAGPGRRVTICGSIYDEAGVSSLTINGQVLAVEAGTEVPFTRRLTTDTDTLDLVAKDRLGNQTSARISFLKSEIQNPKSKIATPVLLACADSDASIGLLAGLFGSRDTRPPSIRLKGWTDTQTVFLEKVYIEGQIMDESKIVSLSINQVPILRRKGLRVFFSHLADLQKGENNIVIEAGDEAGNRATKRISIIRNVPKALQLDERLSLTVLPFEQKGTISEASLSFQDNLIDSVVNQNRFRVVERDKLDLILQEQKLSRSKLIDKSTALRLGRLLAAQSIITGSIIETRTGIEIVGRMIDAETSEILATEDVYDEVKDLPALRSLAEGMAVKFHRDFPLLDGLVIQKKGKYIFTDIGQNKIKLQRRLIVYREEPVKHPVTGKILGSDNIIIGRARVTQVMPGMSKGELFDVKKGAVKRLDRVITE